MFSVFKLLGVNSGNPDEVHGEHACGYVFPDGTGPGLTQIAYQPILSSVKL